MSRVVDGYEWDIRRQKNVSRNGKLGKPPAGNEFAYKLSKATRVVVRDGSFGSWNASEGKRFESHFDRFPLLLRRLRASRSLNFILGLFLPLNHLSNSDLILSQIIDPNIGITIRRQ
jgi:hypothetical protein